MRIAVKVRLPRGWLAFAFCSAIAAWAAPVRAQAIRAAFVYPLQGQGVGASLVADVEDSLHAALARTAGSGPFTPGARESLAPSCGEARVAKTWCLARLAGGGMVLRGIVKPSGSLLSLSINGIDASGRVYGPVRSTIDPALQNANGLVQALEVLAAMAPRSPKSARTTPGQVANGSARSP